MTAFGGHISTVQLLFDSNAVIKSPNVPGCTVLHQIANPGHEETAELLLEREADIKTYDKLG
jgi:ankyrin repeat protein